MRVLRIAPARQLDLFAARPGPAAGHWDGLPEQARAEILMLLARIVLAGDGQPPAGAVRREAAGD
jgi:hypothetical protein